WRPNGIIASAEREAAQEHKAFGRLGPTGHDDTSRRTIPLGAGLSSKVKMNRNSALHARPAGVRMRPTCIRKRTGLMNRRQFIRSASATAFAVQQLFGADPSRYKIGYTTNTRAPVGGWQNDPFVGFSEARELGFRWVEAFATA